MRDGEPRPVGEVPVWDPLVRVAHWILVIAFFTAYLSEGDAMPLHSWAGYTVAGVLAVRVLWGFIGPRYARFSDFVRGPRDVLRYLVRLASFRAPRYLGHSPAGGAMVTALLAVLATATFSGMMTYAIEDGRGPLAPLVAAGALGAPASALATTAWADDEEREMQGGKRESVWEEVHEVSADLALILVILHVSGVVLASVVHRENLVRSMVTGRKRGPNPL